MATTSKNGLPLIDSSMTANVPRDLNALSGAVDTLIGDMKSTPTASKEVAGAISELHQDIHNINTTPQDGSITDAMIGTRTISDSTAPTSDSGAPTSLWGWLAYMLKSLMGTSSWRALPSMTISAIITALGLKAPLASPALTGTPTAPTAAAGTSTTQIATTVFASTAVSNHAADTSHVPFAVAAGSANTYTATISPAPTALTAGLALSVQIATANTGTSTINVNSLGAKSILTSKGTALTSGKLVVGGIYTLRYNGTSFILQGEGGEYGTAATAQVLTGYTFGTENGITNGSMANNEAVTITPTTSEQTIPAGYHNGSGKVLSVVGQFYRTKLVARRYGDSNRYGTGRFLKSLYKPGAKDYAYAHLSHAAAGIYKIPTSDFEGSTKDTSTQYSYSGGTYIDFSTWDSAYTYVYVVSATTLRKVDVSATTPALVTSVTTHTALGGAAANPSRDYVYIFDSTSVLIKKYRLSDMSLVTSFTPTGHYTSSRNWMMGADDNGNLYMPNAARTAVLKFDSAGAATTYYTVASGTILSVSISPVSNMMAILTSTGIVYWLNSSGSSLFTTTLASTSLGAYGYLSWSSDELLLVGWTTGGQVLTPKGVSLGSYTTSSTSAGTNIPVALNDSSSYDNTIWAVAVDSATYYMYVFNCGAVPA